MKNRTLLFIKTPPPKTGYFAGNINWVPTDTAKEWIYDKYAIDAEKILPAKPYFAPDEVASFEGVSQAEKFIKKMTAKIEDEHDALKDAGEQLEILSKKITALQKKRDSERVGSYAHVNLNSQIEELKKELPELEKLVKSSSGEIKKARILLYNAQIKFYTESFEALSGRKEFAELQNRAKEMIAQNEKIRQLFYDTTQGMSLGFLKGVPFLNSRQINTINQSLAESTKVLEEISQNIADKLRAKIWEIYRSDFHGKLKENK